MYQNHSPRLAKGLSDIDRTGKPIWENLFMVQMRYKDTCSEEYLRIHGMPTVGDEALDRAMHNDTVDTYITIDKMIEYYKRGVVLSVRKHEDTKKIYDIIRAYLAVWAINVREGINVGDAPIEDLMLLDKFAEIVYPHAVQHQREDNSDLSWIRQFAMDGGWMTRGEMSRPSAEVRATTPPPAYDSMGKIFSERIHRGAQRAPDPDMYPSSSGGDEQAPLSRWERS